MAKPVKVNKGAVTGKLMDNQDRVRKGDREAVKKIPTTILVPEDIKEEAQEIAQKNGTTLTWMMVEGLMLKIKEYK